MISGPNGEPIHSEPEKPNGNEPYTMILTMDRQTLKVNIGGNLQDIDTAMNMLSTALRYLDVQYRVAAGIQAQQQLNQHNRDMAAAAAMLKGSARQ